jgi:uncharacterized protein
MTTMMRIDLTCPNCGNEFSTETWASTNTFGGKTTDFRSLASGMQTLALEIHTCEVCGYTGGGSQFEESKVTKKVSELINERLTPLVQDERNLPWRRYEYAAWIADWEGRPPDVIAWYYLKGAWCCADDRVEGEGDSETYYRRMAIDYFRRAVDGGSLDPGELAVDTYLIGEEYRRVGEAGSAAPWLDSAVERASEVPGLDWLRDLARQQKADPQELLT